MPTYRAPIEDFRFLLTEVFDASRLSSYPGYEEATTELLISVLAEGGRVCEELLAPLNQPGDAEGCTWDNGTVRTPRGFREAFASYAQGGWIGLSADPLYGGQGLPLVLRVAVNELTVASNLSFAMYPGLTQGVFEALHSHGSDELKSTYLPKLAAGEWAGTMCLTEAHAGTDLGMIRTRAVPMDDGSFSLSGTKIFITAGEHDLTSNIVHLVLARLPDAPQGSRGISMFLVPRNLPDPDGTPGVRNGVTCGAIEHKMGIRGSATCVLNFDGARGWLVGEPNRGLRGMFTMMNAARIDVGIQGLGLAEVSYQNAVAYARERLQGRNLAGPVNNDGPADPIISHADIRRGLLFMRSFIQGARALAMFTSLHLDDERRHPEPTVRDESSDLVALLTPVIKAFFTDLAFESTNHGLQTLGGHGYIREFGMEQFVRDARIGQIYEGTNYVQAIDLVGRKLAEGNGRLFRRYAAAVGDEIAVASRLPALSPWADILRSALTSLEEATLTIARRATRDPQESGAAAVEYLRFFGYVALGHMWLRMARIASTAGNGAAMSPDFYKQKIATADFWFRRMMPATLALSASVAEGGRSIFGFPWQEF